MAHGIDGRKLGRKTGPRRALYKSLIVAVLRYEQIRTTEARAKEVRGQVEKIITLAKQGTLAKIRPDHSIFFQRELATPEKRLSGAAMVMTQLAGLAK